MAVVHSSCRQLLLYGRTIADLAPHGCRSVTIHISWRTLCKETLSHTSLCAHNHAFPTQPAIAQHTKNLSKTVLLSCTASTQNDQICLTCKHFRSVIDSPQCFCACCSSLPMLSLVAQLQLSCELEFEAMPSASVCSKYSTPFRSGMGKDHICQGIKCHLGLDTDRSPNGHLQSLLCADRMV